MKVLITGIAGHLGSALAKYIVENYPSVEVVGIDDYSSGYSGNAPIGCAMMSCSLHENHEGEEFNFWLNRLFENCDYVFHFAAYPAECLSPFIRMHNYQSNLVSTARVVSKCIQHSVKRLVFTSSMAVYGNGKVPFDETHDCRPIDPYGNAKLACERDIQIASTQHGLDWCIIRPHNVFGVGQDIWTPYRNVFGIWMNRHLQGLPIRIYGDGGQQRAFSYIDDIVPCLWRAATTHVASQQVINLGGKEPISISDAAAKFMEVVRDDVQILYAEPRHEVRNAWCTIGKSQAVLDYKENTTLLQGLERMWEWATKVWHQFPERRNWKSRHPEIELETGLYEYWQDGSEVKV